MKEGRKEGIMRNATRSFITSISKKCSDAKMSNSGKSYHILETKYKRWMANNALPDRLSNNAKITAGVNDDDVVKVKSEKRWTQK